MRIAKYRLFNNPGMAQFVKGVATRAGKRSTAAAKARLSINFVITDYYRGAINDVIYMIVRNAESVKVSILCVDGKLLESGPATRSSSGLWNYHAVIRNPDFPGTKVLILATDSHGNQQESVEPVL
ncbi:hypothetical protein [Chitinophaga rhizophila]|uniref:Uncharacterized protein n=1 Tax=Chitinophaga rhizophila TaxID=2866212 RepID=A0ABS7GC20_9BACT|nr:hypothetical protein [Chitinophaga rhizophila]MBW8684680.1 hypothetical protein [Chitinophaga rhizophila]